jgi:hypothetical protein
MSTSSTFPASRASGARAALDYFQVPGTDERVAEYAQHKQQMVVALIQAGDFTAYPDALRFAIATKDAGMLIADASSSKNAGLFLPQIRLDTFAQENRISLPTLRPGLTLLDYPLQHLQLAAVRRGHPRVPR